MHTPRVSTLLHAHRSKGSRVQLLYMLKLINEWYCIYSGMAKSTSPAEVTSNCKKIKPVALVIVELRKSEGIRQAV